MKGAGGNFFTKKFPPEFTLLKANWYQMLRELLVPYPADQVEAYAVTVNVNKPTYDEPDCILPVEIHQCLKED